MIDPHTHSTASDGTSTPRELMYEARAAGLAMIGLTDHDTVAGWAEAASEVPDSGVALLRGMEMSVRFRSTTLHLLAYLFRPDHPRIVDHVARTQESRRTRGKEIVDRLSTDYPITWEEVASRAGGQSSIGRPHIADALIARGIVTTRAEAFERFLLPTSPYFVPHYAPPLLDALEWIKEAGGASVLAHPRALSRGEEIPTQMFATLAEAGLFGIEIDHRENRPNSLAELENVALVSGLARFGSSDYHGSGKANHLGEHTTAPAVIDALIGDCQMEVVRP
ncbi:PHP domain-containing protein [Arcanobacterium haemolyticum]|nr:PHP domain-containing protein [Arcanobacterium haemolyticum]